MKPLIRWTHSGAAGLALLVAVLSTAPARGADIGTTFTYQGSLSDGGVAPTAAYDFRFTLYDDAVAGTTVSAALTPEDVSVVSGIFTLELDFGASPFAAAEARWLQVEVRPGASTGAYTALPRQRLTAAPAALGLALPYSQTGASPMPMMQLGNNGTGSGAIVLAGGGTGLNYGVQGITFSSGTDAAGVRGWAAGGGDTYGVEGVASGPTGIGVRGQGSTGVLARGDLRGLLAENNGSGPAVVATGAGGDDANATIHGTNSGTGPALFLTGQGQNAAHATMRVDNTQATQGMAAYVTNNSNYATAHFKNAGSGEVLWLEDAGATGHFIVAAGSGGWKFWVDGAGVTHTKVLEILGGADLSERFDVAGGADTAEPGMVVSIDPAHEGRLELSRTPYDHRVAGILSGAGGVQPGMLMGQRGSVADGDHPVALTGRVYCRATAANGAIRPGDLLTTSAVPGHAMRVDDPSRAQGAILGKAMGSLARGEGLVLVLVGLQ